MSALLLLLLAQAGEPASQPASQPARPGTPADVRGQLTFVLELAEKTVNVQESWQLKTSEGAGVAGLTFRVPKEARLLAVDPDTPGFAGDQGQQVVRATEAVSGQRSLNYAYLLDLRSDTLEIGRVFPVATGARIIVEEAPGLSVSTNVPARKTNRALGAKKFLLYDLESELPAGAPLTVRVTGLPSHSRLPRYLALGAVALVLLWLAWSFLNLESLRRRMETSAPAVDGVLSARARKEQLVKALEVLERDFKDAKVKDKRFERRREELLSDLARVLKELERSKRLEPR